MMNKAIITIKDNRNGSKRRKDSPIIFLLFHKRLRRAARLFSVFIHKWYEQKVGVVANSDARHIRL